MHPPNGHGTHLAGIVGAIERLLWTADARVACDEGSPSCYGLMDLAAAMDGPREPSAR